jgi:lipopolysaccharide export system permease protein
MKLSPTLNRYLSRTYILNLFFMIGILWGIIYLFDTVELLRRASKRKDVPLGMVMKMGLLKLPDTGLTIFSFAILFSAMYTFWRLNRRHELVVVRAAGFSVWQFLSPVISVALVTGFLIITAVNPFSAVLLARYKALESTYLTHNHNQIALFDEGLWLRQVQDDDHYIILHAGGIKMPGWHLRDVTALYFDKNDNFRQRIDAETATLTDKEWLFETAIINIPDKPPQTQAEVTLPTDLTAQDIEESFASPDTMSVWRLPAFIRTVESTGFDATRLRIHFQSLLAQPFLFAAMILLAAAVSLHPPRFRSTLRMIVMGIVVGFATFFTSSFLLALGASHQIPVFLAAWSPTFVMSLLGVAAILRLEDE